MCTLTQAQEAGYAVCPELGADQSAWSLNAPMASPSWAKDAFVPMRAAILLADQGEVAASVDLYQQSVPDRALNEWYDLHAQYAYKWRCSAQGVPAPKKLPKSDRSPALGGPETDLPLGVFSRDSYRCRYCDTRLFAVAAFRRYEKTVGNEVFPLSGMKGNKPKAGASLVFRPVADHVEPWSRGGMTDLDNLVTSCWPCNFGKMEYTVKELGITDPRSRPPVADGWDGLRSIRTS
jgi:5-methylcytosine-specific restriction endonuclease McrA